MESVTHGFIPLDLESIRKDLPKKYKITTDKDLEHEIDEILVTLKDLSKSNCEAIEIKLVFT